MMLFYVDESGTGWQDERTPYFCLAALAIPAEVSLMLEDRVAALKRCWFPDLQPREWEIKAQRMYQGVEPWQRHLKDARIAAMWDVVNLFSELPCRIIALRTDKKRFPVQSESEGYMMTAQHLWDTLETFLISRHEYGIQMWDSRSDLHSASQDRRLLDAYHSWRTTCSACRLDVPWFGRSNLYAGLQLADLAAYLLHRTADSQVRNKQNADLTHLVRVLDDKLEIVNLPVSKNESTATDAAVDSAKV